MKDKKPPHISEMKAGWKTLLGATVGVSTGATLFNYTASYFVTAMQGEFGWARAQIAAGVTITMVLGAIMLPLMGYLTDRFGSLRIGGLGLIAYGLTLSGLASIPGNLWAYYGIMSVLAISFASTTAVTFAPLVAARFRKRRGLALGVMMAGPAILLVPFAPLLTNLIATLGWRAGYLAMAAGAFLIALPGLLLASRSSADLVRDAHAGATGMRLPEVLRTSSYWKLFAGVLLSTWGIGGFLNQHGAMLADKGFSATEIGLLASVFVTMILVGRTGIGFLLDQINPPLVAMLAMLGAAAGGLLMLEAQPSFLTAAIFLGLIGCGMGSEGDIQAFFSARQFGLRSFSTIFGTLAMLTAIGMGLGAFSFGRLYDVYGDYDMAIYLAASGLAVAGLIFATLPRAGPSFSPARQEE